jgi:enoyl-CoA hydratase/carnithine racemase
MAVVEWKKEGTVAVITMCNGENRHNPDFVAGMMQAFDEIEKDETIYAVVIASNDKKSWSQGIDLTWMMGRAVAQDQPAIVQFMYSLNAMFTRVLLFPLPVIAAINGHAFGDGVMLACVCDFRFMKADRGFFCLPEVDINIPLLPAMQAIVRRCMGEYKFREMALTGKRYGAAELAEHNVLVKASANEEELMADAMAYAKTFTKQRSIFGEMKKRMNKHIVEIMKTEDPEFIDSGKLMI